MTRLQAAASGLTTSCASQGSDENAAAHYGILLARTAGLPHDLLDRADAVVSILQSKHACSNGSASEVNVFSLAQRLLSLSQSADGEEAVRDTLRALRSAAADLPAEIPPA